jgi:hypothetical protein
VKREGFNLGNLAPLRQPSGMRTLTADLQTTLTELDSDTRAKLERLVRDAMALVRPASKTEASGVDTNGWPLGYFERTYGCLSDQEFEAPADPPAEPLKEW